jgi:hypothetical protein
MQLTTDFIKKNFIVFNNEYFEGKLRMPEFKVVHTKCRLGLCDWKTISGVRTNYTISISDYYMFGEKKYQNVILHEMIHLYIRQNNIKDTRAHHGQVFYSIATRINRHGWNISRTDSVEGYDTAKKKIYSLVAFEDSKGKYFLMAYNPKKESYYVGYFAKCSWHFKNPVWFTSDDSKAFGSLTECRSGVRGRFISKEDYSALQKKYSLPLAM